MGRLHVKFHEDRCKGEAVMQLKPFYLTAQFLHCDLDLWPFDPKVHRAHTWLMGRLHVKFHEDRCKGEAFIRLKPFYLIARLQTDGRTDRVIPVYPPPNFVAGGIINITLFMRWQSTMLSSTECNTCIFVYNTAYWEFLASVNFGRCVKFSPSPIFTIYTDLNGDT